MSIKKIVKRIERFLELKTKKQEKKVREFEKILDRLAAMEIKALWRLNLEQDPKRIKELKKRLRLIRSRKEQGIRKIIRFDMPGKK
ncbi:MAG: hypothetical protein HQL75_05520 [Magnetococcales bacterium]|nr:hypothetical protein [Magnetococcales bacterium]